MNQSEARPQPGWYPDQTNPLQARWWDGVSWTDRVLPIEYARNSGNARGFGLGVALTLFVPSVLWNGCVATWDSGDCSQGDNSGVGIVIPMAAGLSVVLATLLAFVCAVLARRALKGRSRWIGLGLVCVAIGSGWLAKRRVDNCIRDYTGPKATSPWPTDRPFESGSKEA